MCIYYKREGLTYNSQEHVFPAALGGKAMLDKGVVSDQFNSDISKIEQHFFRNGMISVPRMMVGPGKRGSLGSARATKSSVQLVTDENNIEKFSLGYTVLGKPVCIPTMSLNFTSGRCGFSCDIIKQEEVAKLKTDFKQKIENAQSLNVKWILENRLPEDIILVGIADGIEERFNCFYFYNENNSIPRTLEALAKIGTIVQFGEEPINSKYIPQVMGTFEHREDHIRIYGKIAVNFLALIKGTEFINRPEFEDVKNWIAYGDDYPFIAADATNDNPLVRMDITMPADSHYVFLAKGNNELIAKVFLFGGFSIQVLIAKGKFEGIATDGFICDWRNQKEYRLMEYIGQNLPKY